MKMAAVAIGLMMSAPLTAWSQEPICIIDGVRLAPHICSRSGALDPQRIESIEVLKGRAAAEAHGADAAGGVILITMKSGAVPSAPNEGDPLARHLFPPELVMAHQQAINLTDRQRSAIQAAVREAQGQFVDLHFAVSREMEHLQRLLERPSVEEAAVLAQVDSVLAAERRIKRAQLTLMIRIKNELDERQQLTLQVLRR